MTPAPPSRPARSILDIVIEQAAAGEHPLVVFATDHNGTDLDFEELGDGK